MDPINNPMTQLAKMYSLIEGYLRRDPISMSELCHKQDILDTQKNPWQPRDIIKQLTFKKHIIVKGIGKAMTYEWDKDSPPFILRLKQQRLKKEQASKPIIAPHELPITAPKRIVATKEIELVIGGNMLVIGRNEKTGRLRIVIESIE